ncbi:hypothetical protein C8R44DRAFT_318605 [Mycena epipterygia]|nr:hypothetical protein C8R44DRAFT_318605 [Mycena epipterygia]
MVQNQVVFALYKNFIRQSRRLPHLYLRQFWRIKAFDDVRRILNTDDLQGLRDKKFKRMSKDLRKLDAANKQNTKAFRHVLDVAYGRKGKLKRELMEPILTDPTAPIPPRIIPAVESSRPPVYSKELTALLTTGLSRTTRPLTKKYLRFPPTLSPRADPTSEESRLLGPLSKRREKNARWRYFVAEWQKTRAPLQVVVENGPNFPGVTLEDVRRVGIRSLPMQGLQVFEDIEKLASQGWIRPPTHREHVYVKDPDRNPSSEAPHIRHPSRWLRRRYQTLLNHIPILTYRTPQGNAPSYSVSLSPNRLDMKTNIAEADASDVKWME